MTEDQPRRRLCALFAVAGPFLAYLRTMAPTVYGLDSAELTTGAYVLGIVHAPGSPLFLLLGHLFTWLPVGDVGYRVNLLSVCAAAGAAGFVYAILVRWTDDAVLALAGAWFLASTYYFWVAALAAELYALHAFCVAGLIWLGLVWREQQRPWQLWAFAFFFGLALGNHLSLSMLAPGFAYLVLSEPVRIWRRPGVMATAVVCGLLGASVYLYLPLRALGGTPLNYARQAGVDVATWRGFWWMVTGRMFASRFLGVPLVRLPLEVTLYAYRLWSNFVGFGCVLGVVGLLDDFKRRRPVHLALLLMFLGHLGFVITYNVLDKELMLVPTYLIWSLWAALGAATVMRYIAEQPRHRLVLSGGTLLLLMSIGNLVLNFSFADISRDWSARQRGEAIFRTIAPGAVFIGTWAEVPILEYLQLVERLRPDVETANLFFVQGAPSSKLIAERTAAGRPVYASVPTLLEDRHLALTYEAGCDCYRLDPAGQ